MRLVAIGLGLFGLACSAAAALGVGLVLSPITPGKLAYYALVAGGSILRLALLGVTGCLIAMPAAVRAGRWRWVSVAALGLGGLSTVISVGLAARVYLTVRSQRLPFSLWDSLVGPRLREESAPEIVTFAAGEGWQLDADLYRPRLASRQAQLAPAVIVVHGGAWRGGDKGENPIWNRWLADSGYLVLDIQYRLAPVASWREAVDDIRSAMTWVHTHADELGVDRGRVALLGRSAGGHLALLAAYAGDSQDRQPPRCVMAFYAPTDLVRLHAEARHSSAADLRAGIRALLGTGHSDPEAACALASPLERVHAGVPPTLLVHGGWDTVVPPDHSRLLALALERAGGRANLVTVPYARHAFDLVAYGPSTYLARDALFAFLADPTGA